MRSLHERRYECGYFGPIPPPRTVKEACRIFHELDPESPRYSDFNKDERHAIERELKLFWDFPKPWCGCKWCWNKLDKALQDAIDRTCSPQGSSSSSSSEEEPGFDDNWEHIAPAGGASHRAFGSGSADRTGGHPIEMPSHHGGHNHGGHNHGGHNHGGHNHGGHNTGIVHENHGNSQHQGGHTPLVPAVDSYVSDTSSDTSSDYEPQSSRNAGGYREDHGNSQHRARRNVFEESDYSAGRSHSAGESQSTDSFSTSSRSRDSSSTPEPIRVRDMLHSNRMHQQSNALPHRRRRH